MQEKSRNTVEKYLRDVGRFLAFAWENRKQERGETILNRRVTLEYKEELLKKYQTTSVNSMPIAVNCYLKFVGKEEWKLQTVRVQRQIFRSEEKELTRNEYCRLVREANNRGNIRLCHILQTIGSTGIPNQ